MKNGKKQLFVPTFFFLAILAFVYPLHAAVPGDSHALEGVKTTKAIFDINFSEPKKLALYLSVIDQTHTSLVVQGYKPDFVIAFRGSSVRLITTETWAFSDEDQPHLQKGAALIKKLGDQGVLFEACNIATQLFKVDNATLISGIRPVGNTFISLIGYQAKGYSLIPIQ